MNADLRELLRYNRQAPSYQREQGRLAAERQEAAEYDETGLEIRAVDPEPHKPPGVCHVCQFLGLLR